MRVEPGTKYTYTSQLTVDIFIGVLPNIRKVKNKWEKKNLRKYKEMKHEKVILFLSIKVNEFVHF